MMVVVETVDPGKILPVLLDPEIYDRISADDAPPAKEFLLPGGPVRYIVGLEDGPFAVFIIHPHEDGEKVHIQVLKDHRDKAHPFARKALEFTNGRLYAEIPTLYPDVMDFAEQFGFEITRIVNKGYRKGGVDYPTAMMERERWQSA